MPSIRYICALIFAALVMPGCSSEGGDDFRVQSPNGRIEFRVQVDDSGRPVYQASLDGQQLIGRSALGIRLQDGRTVCFAAPSHSSRVSNKDQSWQQPWGERRIVRDQHNEIAIHIGDDEATCVLRIRAFNDGIGFRYEVDVDGVDRIAIDEELTQFALATDGTAWWQPGSHRDKYEVLYRRTAVSEIENAHSPLTVRLANGTHISLHEAALIDYSAYTLEPVAPGVLQTALRPWSDGIAVRTDASFVTPWRTIQVSDNAAGLANSNLILNLNEPNKLGDVSWVEPGKYVGIWWAIHLGLQTWHVGPAHGATTTNTRQHIDFAARHGFDGVLVEGWNVGWGADENHDLLRPTPDFDLAGLSAYARHRGVALIGHHETFANVPEYEAVLEDAFDLYEYAGVSQVKTGYVGFAGSLMRIADDGSDSNEWHDSQYAVDHQLRVLEAAAKRRISINTHEPVKDTGLRRTYPNWLTREGSRGQEFAVWGEVPNPPEHTVILPYTRMLAGPMDFTPGVFGLEFEANGNPRRVNTTLAKQLALYVVLYSPVQMVPDLFENYARYPDAFQFIVDVPTDWEESVALDGEVGEFFAIARRDREGDDWFLGAVTNEAARELELPLTFLDTSESWTATLYIDAEDANWQSNPHAYAIEERQVDPGSVLKLKLAPGGGAAVHFAPRKGE